MTDYDPLNGTEEVSVAIGGDDQRFENMFPDPTSEVSLKDRVRELEAMLAERDTEEITRRASIAELQTQITLLEGQAYDLRVANTDLEEHVEGLEALADARVNTINQWCERAESFGATDLASLYAVAADYRALRELMCAEPAKVFREVEKLKMQLLKLLNDKLKP